MEDVIGPLFPLCFVLAMLIESRLRTGRQPAVRGFRLKGSLFFLGGAVINGVAPALLTAPLSRLAPFDLTDVPLALGATLVFLATSFADYWLHRLMHVVTPIWLWAHQLHHSAERVDVAGFAYAHPFELVLSVLTATVLGCLLGVSADAVLLGGFAWYLSQLFLHMDIDTPSALGFFIQRPEAHRVHHTRGIHAYNYGLPLWDALFGTRRNPEQWDRQYGFWDGASERVLPMLFGRDVATTVPSRQVLADTASTNEQVSRT